MKRGKLFLIIGPSCAGKTVIVDYVLKHRPHTVKAISFTTRDQRPGEKDKVDYFFVSEDKFKDLVKKDKFIEHANVYGHLYGTTEDSFSPINEGKDVIKIIDYQGALKIKKLKIPNVSFFFCPKDEDVLRKRIIERGDKDVEERLSYFEEELKHKKDFDYYIDTSGVDDHIKEHALQVMKIMNK
ncbi:MAG TPA: guanylate kinase [Candidatus Nanoarchaeia archaeon]|nr:guanylate kinase [Candidatus Nanoarchaeia archaeon]